MSSRTQKVTITNESRVLKEMRLTVGLSMRAAGSQIGRSDTYISQIENGRMDAPKGDRLERLLGAYGGIKVRSFLSQMYRDQKYPDITLLKRNLLQKRAQLGTGNKQGNPSTRDNFKPLWTGIRNRVWHINQMYQSKYITIWRKHYRAGTSRKCVSICYE